jgi:ubiquinone/menaquinone biosynthesis C-methylase UbiE
MTRRFVGLAASVLLAGACGCPAAAAERRRAGRDSWQQPKRVVADLSLRAGSVIADVGAGRGYFTFRLAEAVGEAGKVCATEISAKSLKSITDRAKREKASNIECVLSEATDTKLKDASCDAAILCNVLHHVPKAQRPALSRDIVRALKPGGFFYIVDWREDAKIKHDLNRRIPRDELLKLAKDAGLSLDAEYHYLVHQVFLRFRKPPAK